MESNRTPWRVQTFENMLFPYESLVFWKLRTSGVFLFIQEWNIICDETFAKGLMEIITGVEMSKTCEYGKATT